MPNPLRKINKMVRQEQSQGGRIGGGPDEPPSASMRKGKPGRTAPSSRVKKMKKKVSSKFSEPREEYNEADDLMPDHRRGLTYVEPAPRGYEARKRVKRKNDAEYSRDSAARQGVLDERYERGTPPKITANDIYYRLRDNLSPANARLLDILAGKGGSKFEDGFEKVNQNDIPF